MRSSALWPSSWASADSATRWRSAAMATPLTSSGTTNARAADPHDHICRAANFRISHIFVFDELFCRQLFIECMEHRGFHLLVSPKCFPKCFPKYFLFCGHDVGASPPK